MADTLPCDVCNVKQTINTTEVDERTVICDVLDDTLKDLAFLKVGYQFGPGLCTGLFQNSAARYNNVTTTTVNFQNLERLRCSHQWTEIANWANVDLAARQKCCRS